MSLSYTPSVKITLNSARNISDELLGGAIQFCRETGYKQNIMMLTFFWSAFLLKVQSQLNDVDITQKVIDSYIHSLNSVFPNLYKDPEMQEAINEACHHYCSNLSNDFPTLKSESELDAFFQIANKLNSQDAQEEYVSAKVDPQIPFIRISDTLNSSTYRILHQINSPDAIQYKGIVDAIRFSRLHQEPHSQAQPSSSSSYSPQYQSAPRTSKAPKLCLKIFIIIFAIIIGIGLISSVIDDEDSDLTPVIEPKSGEILSGTEYYNASQIKIIAPNDSSYVVKLKTASGVERLSFYVRAGETVTVGVPCEHLYVYFACGDIWYGKVNLFGKKTEYSMDKELIYFEKGGRWTYTLYKVNNGNFSEKPIDEGDFK